MSEPDLATAARLEELAGAMAGSGRLEEAFAYLQRAAVTYSGRSDLRAGHCLRGCSELAIGLGLRAEAIGYLEAARDRFEEANEPEEAAACDRRMGELTRDSGEPARAQGHFEAAWQRYEDAGAVVDAAYAALGVAGILLQREDPASALYVVHRVREMLRDQSDEWSLQADARALAIEGQILAASGQLAEARAALARADDFFASRGQVHDAARALVTRAAVERMSGRSDASLEASAQARSRFEGLGLEVEAATCRVQTGMVLIDVGRPGEAVDALEGALTVLERAELGGAAECELQLGIARRSLASLGPALGHFERASELFAARAGSIAHARTQSWIATTLTDLGEFDRARGHHRTALDLLAPHPAERARAIAHQAFTELTAGDDESAAALAATVVDGYRGHTSRGAAASALVVLSRVATRRRALDEAVSLAQRAAVLAVDRGDPSGAARARWAVALAYRAGGRAAEARAVLESVRRRLDARNEVLDCARVDVDLAGAVDDLNDSTAAATIRNRARVVLAASAAASTTSSCPTR